MDLADFQRLDVVEALELAVEGDVGFPVVAPDPPGGEFHVVFLELGEQVVDGQIGGGQLLPVHQNVDLHLVGAPDPDFAHPRQGGEAVGQLVVGVVVDLVDGPVSQQIDVGHRGGVVVDLADRGFLDAVGEILPDPVELFPDLGGGHVDVGPHVEFEGNAAFVFHAHGGNVLQPFE